MRRRQATTTEPAMPPHLATFNPDDWPLPPADWEFSVRMYQRRKWNHARTVWRREQRGAS